VEEHGEQLWPRPLGRGELIALDGLAAVLYASALMLLPVDGSGGAPLWLRCLVVAAMAVPLTVRRRWPRTVFGVVLAATVASLVFGVVNDSFVGAAFALYPVALTAPSRGRRRLSAQVVGVFSIALLLLATVTGTPAAQARTIGTVLFGAALLGGSWALGRAVRDRRAYAARAVAHLARQAVTEERLRIARELHDVVAHSIGVIAVKAAVANHVADTNPQEVRDALRVIESASRGTLAELRQVLGILRSQEAPWPAGLADLAERAALAGVDVELDVRGLDGLPEGLRLSVFRIVQEALTNVMKHAAPAQARVTVAAGGREVAVDVVDDGAGTRVAAYGGSFTAGPGDGGGFTVSVRLPYAATEEPRP